MKIGIFFLYQNILLCAFFFSLKNYTLLFKLIPHHFSEINNLCLLNYFGQPFQCLILLLIRNSESMREALNNNLRFI